MTNEHSLTGVKFAKGNFSFAEIFVILLISGQIALYVFMWFRLLGDSTLKTMDFVSFYGAGRLIRSGEYRQIYNLQAGANVQSRVFGTTYQSHMIFTHPPHVTPLLAVIASDNYVHAYIYWTITNLLALFLCMELSRRYLLYSGWNLRSSWIGVLGCFSFFPVFISLLGGQDTSFTLLGLFIWMFALLKGREISAGLGLAFATLSPTIAGALVLPMFVSRRRASLWFITGMIGLAVYSLTLIGIQGIMEFLFTLQTSSQGLNYGINWSSMYNLLGLLLRAFPNLNVDTIHTVAWAATVLSIFSMCIFWWNQKSQLGIRHISIAVLLGTFTAPHLHLHGLSYLLLPLLGMMIILHERGYKTTALVLPSVISGILIGIMFLIPAWNYAAYYLLMLALLIGFFVFKPALNGM